MASLSNGMNLLGVGISYQYMIRGGVLAGAVIFDVMTRKKIRKLARFLGVWPFVKQQ